MQIIILRKNKTQSLKIQNWMYAAMFAGALTLTCTSFLSYLYFTQNQSFDKNLNISMQETISKKQDQNYGLNEKIKQMQAQLSSLDQLLSSVKEKLNFSKINTLETLKDNHNHNHNNHNHKKFEGQGGAIELSELEHPLIQKNQSDPAFAILDDTTESEIKKLALSHQKKEFNGSSFHDLNQMVNQLGEKIQNRLQEVSSINTLLEFRDIKNIKFDLMPVQAPRLTSGFGLRNDPFNGGRAMHSGQDFAGPVGTPIHAVRAGVVVASEYHPQYGHMIDIDHGNGLKTRYAHNSENLYKVGSSVKKGAVIAKMGSTGRSTGSHLHFEVRLNNVPYNPVLFMSGSALAQR